MLCQWHLSRFTDPHGWKFDDFAPIKIVQLDDIKEVSNDIQDKVDRVSVMAYS
jgi:hypothetical protein